MSKSKALLTKYDLPIPKTHDVFFIYRKEESRESLFVRQTAHKLQEQMLNCCYEEKDFTPGMQYNRCFCQFLQTCRNIAVVLSKSSLDNREFQYRLEIVIKYTVNYAIPIIMLFLDEEITSPHCNPYLIRIDERTDWLNQLIDSLRNPVIWPALENIAKLFLNCIMLSTSESKHGLLKKPVAWKLFQFFSKAQKVNQTIEGLGACGITISDNSITIDMIALQCNANKGMNIVESYRNSELGEKKELTLVLDYDIEIESRKHSQFISCLREICHQIITRPNSKNTGWFLSYNSDGNATPCKAETHALNIVRDAVTEKIIERISYPEYICLSDRLKSFSLWPKSKTQDPKQLAEAGFFFAGPKDYVRCFYCKGGLCNWTTEHDPWARHAGWFPYCPFVKMNKTREFISEERLNVLPYMPYNADYDSLQTRKDSFIGFPKTQLMSTAVLAECGFISFGMGDAITCHHCGVTFSLASIDPDDDVWRAHGNLSEDCPYVEKHKSGEYLKNFQRKDEIYEIEQSKRILTFTIQYEKDTPHKHNMQVLISNSPYTPYPPISFSDITK